MTHSGFGRGEQEDAELEDEQGFPRQSSVEEEDSGKRTRLAGEDKKGEVSTPGQAGAELAGLFTRRDFFRCAALAAGGLAAAGLIAGGRAASASPLAPVVENLGQASVAAPRALSPLRMAKARYWKPLGNMRIQCHLCPKECEVGDRERGFCGVRENRGGVYYTLVYGSAAAARPDPIEKKPLFHFMPGTLAYSIATAGCNMNCKDCQNWELSQARPEQLQTRHLPPSEVARQARLTGCDTIAYTYNEPTIFYEYMYDTAVEGRKRGLRSVVITAGYINQEPLRALIPRVDAIKVDLKGFSEAFYRRYCSGGLGPVLDTIKTIHARGCWLELVLLIVPGINDAPASIEAMCKWIRNNVGPEVPVHFTRFFPSYQLRNLPPTPLATLERCYKIARSVGLHFVYLGNVPADPAQNTLCPGCGKTLIERRGYSILANRLRHGRCPYCGRKIPGVWE